MSLRDGRGVFSGRRTERAGRRHSWPARRISYADLAFDRRGSSRRTLRVHRGAQCRRRRRRVLRKRWDYLVLLAAVGTVLHGVRLGLQGSSMSRKRNRPFASSSDSKCCSSRSFSSAAKLPPGKWAAAAVVRHGFAALRLPLVLSYRQLGRAAGFPFHLHLPRGDRPACARDSQLEPALFAQRHGFGVFGLLRELDSDLSN